MPPTQTPPVPDVFGQYLNPQANQQSGMEQMAQAQRQGPQFTGYEHGALAGAGLLNSFMQGASSGRARADAKEAHNEAMKSSQDSQHLNSYMQMVADNPSLDPDAKQALISKAFGMQGKMAETVMKESDHPILKALHPILQGILGGAPADESTKKDPKTGKKSKVKTSYQGPDEDAFKGLMSDYFNASQNMTIEKTYPVKSAALIDQAKAAAAGLAQINGQEPTREQVQRAVAPLLSQGDALAQKYGMKTNPVNDWLETYQPKLQGTQRLQEAQAKELEDYDAQAKQIMGGGQPQQPLTQTQPPPSPQQFGLQTIGPASRVGQPNMSMKPGPGPSSRTGPGRFDTRIDPQEEAAFQTWKAQNAPNDSGEDYDLKGLFKSGQGQDSRGHSTDQFKKPNHPTFSTDSQYSGQGETGGRWETKNGKTTFYASPDNLKYRSAEELKDYFKKEEPGSRLVLPEQTQAQKDAAAPPSAQAKTGTVDPSFLDRAVSVGRATREESVIDGDKQIPTTRWNGKTYDLNGNVIDSSKIGKIITGPRGTPIRVEQTDKNGGKYAVYAFNDGSGKLSIPKDDKGEPYRVPKTEAGLRGQITEVFQSVQRLQQQIFQEQNRLQTIEKDVSNDFTIPPNKKVAEVARRRAEIQPRIDQMNKNLEANQKILMQYGGPGALYDTGMGSSQPPNQYIDQLDQLQ